MEISICHLYPDVLNLYGDRGNIICMEKRAAWRGIGVTVTGLSVGENTDFSQFDIFFMGGGQDFEQEVLLNDLTSGKAGEIKAAAEDEKVFLAVCGGYQIMGSHYKTHEGRQYDFIGALDCYTVGHKERMIGDCMFECNAESGGSTVVGFENHSGKTYLGEGVSPLGKILVGHGNNGEDKTEGARYKNVFATYSHGPILPKNPILADYILETALARKYPEFMGMEPLDDILEIGANTYMRKRLGGAV